MTSTAPAEPEQGTPGPADPDQLQAALSTAAFMQASIQQADSKVGICVAVQAGLAAVFATQADKMSRTWAASTGAGVTASVFTALFAFAFLASGYFLTQAVRPRLAPPTLPNRFGAASLVRMTTAEAVADPARGLYEAWDLARLLAGICLTKHGYVHKALPWVAVMLVSALGWLVTVAAFGAPG
jgi:hypothetical protein